LDGHRAISQLLLQAFAEAGVPVSRDQWQWSRKHSDRELSQAFAAESGPVFAGDRATGYFKLFEALTTPPSEPALRIERAKAAQGHLANAHRLIPGDVRVEILLGVAEIVAGSGAEGAARLKGAIPKDKAVAMEFEKILRGAPAASTAIREAGVDVAALVPRR